MKVVAGECNLIDGCSLALCSATVSVVSAGICHTNMPHMPYMHMHMPHMHFVT